MKLSYRLLLFFTLISIIPIIVVGSYSFYTFRKAVINRTFDQLTSVRVVKKRQIENFFSKLKSDAELYAHSSEIKALARNLSKSQTELCEDSLTQSLQTDFIFNHIFASEQPDAVSILVSGGIGLHVQKDHHGLIKGQVFSDTTGLYKQYIARCAPEGKAGIKDFSGPGLKNLQVYTTVEMQAYQAPALLVFDVPLEAVNRIMLEKTSETGFGNSGESYLTGSDLLMRSTSRFRPNSVMQIKVETTGSKQLLAGESGTGIFPDYRSVKVLSSFDKLDIPDLNWLIFVEIDYEEAASKIYRTGNDILFVSTLLIIFLVGLSLVISRSITQPLRELQNATEYIGQNNRFEKLQAVSNDEIGSLTKAFNRMALRLEKQTTELKEREERLRHFYKATKDGILLHDEGKIILVNQALSNITGFSEEELLGMHLSELVVCSEKKQNKNLPFETQGIRKNGRNYPAEIQSSETDYHGKHLRACVIRDISRRKAMEAELEAEREQRLSAMYNGQETERRRLARELHDGLGQRLIALKLHSEKHFKSSKPAENHPFFGREIDAVVEDVRRMSKALNPPVLDEFGLGIALKNLCGFWSENTTIDIHFNSEGRFHNLPDKHKIYLYRIAQEIMNNAVKHSEAEQLNIEIIKSENRLIFMAEDNGKGFDPKNTGPEGTGLFNIRQRVQLLGGELKIHSEPGKGTLIRINLNT